MIYENRTLPPPLINRKSLKLFLCMIATTLFFIGAGAVSSFSEGFFSRDLTIGSTGKDVKELQIILNRNVSTRLALSGPGSPGQETEYFGPITKNAVTRFQEKYAEEILEPLGLTSGTGYFGYSTRAKVNEMLRSVDGDEVNADQAPIPQTEVGGNGPADADLDQVGESATLDTPQFGSLTPEEIKEIEKDFMDQDIEGFDFTGFRKVDLARPSQYYGPRGSELYLYGLGFTSKNTVHFGDRKRLDNVKALSADTIRLTVPEDIELGYYEIEVENEFGRTTESQVFFVVTGAESVAPEVHSVTPESGVWGSEVTLYGSGFDGSRNILRTPYGVLDGLSSKDGKSITFKVEPFPESMNPAILNRPEVDVNDLNVPDGVDRDSIPASGFREWGLHFYVVNDGGVSKTPAVFNLKI